MVITLPSPLCHRCGQSPKLAKQRVCRNCLTEYQRERRARQRQQTAAVSADVVLTPVTQTTVPAERPLVLCQRCGAARWFEWIPGDWRCQLCGIAPAT